jgi:hypothetical protein
LEGEHLKNGGLNRFKLIYIVILVLAILILVRNIYAIEITTACVPTQETYKTPVLLVGPGCGSWGSQQCTDCLTPLISTELAKSIYVGGNCQLGDFIATSLCTTALMEACCDETWINTQQNKESAFIESQTITGVPVGGELDAANQAYATWVDDPLNDCDDLLAQGYGLSDGLGGASYQSYSPDNVNADVYVDLWKRCGYTAVGGDIVPLENLTGGAGDGISPGEVQQAFEDAMGNQGMTGTNIGDEVQQATEDAFDVTITETSDRPYSIDPGDNAAFTGYDPADLPDYDDIGTKIGNFVSLNPLVTAISGTTLNVVGGSCTLQTTVFGTTIDLGICQTATVLNTLGAIVVLIAGFYSIFITFGRA